MNRRLNLFWGVVVLLCWAWFASTRLAAQDDNWTDTDRALEDKADHLIAQGDYQAAENICSQLIKIHPDSSVPLVLYASALDAQGRFSEALTIAKKATKIDPANFVAQRWVGVSLCRLGQYAQAIEPLKKSLEIDHYWNPASIWLAEAYLKTGDQKQSTQILAEALQYYPSEKQADATSWIADVYYEMHDSQSAVSWWEKSAALGSKNAAQWLAWAYSTGYGVSADAGDSAYWSRIAGDTFPWFPCLPQADDLIKRTNGWLLILVLLLSAALLPILTIGVVGLCLGRGLTTDPSVHWTERARRSYPFQIFLGFCGLLLPIVYAVGSSYYPSSALPVPKWLLFWVVFFVGLLSTNRVIVLWAHRYRERPDSALQNLQNVGATLFIYTPILAVFMIMAANLPSEWNLQAGLIIAAAILAYFWIQFGGWIRLGRLLFLVVPADKELTNAAAALTGQLGCPAPTIWMFRWRKANALAFPFSNSILVTEKLRGLLTTEELNAVLAHEMAHLHEDRGTSLMRLLTPLLLLPLFTLSLWWEGGEWYGLAVCYVVIFVVFFLVRKRRRRMEERADTFGNKAHKETDVYPRALAKIYENNLVPAVMRSKRMVHPHLYDRQLAAGIIPDYPRPKPPARWGSFAALFTVAANVVCLSAVWLLLF